jgi:hypothetical protein
VPHPPPPPPPKLFLSLFGFSVFCSYSNKNYGKSLAVPFFKKSLDCSCTSTTMVHGAAGEQLALQNLSMTRPAHCVNGKDVVYLVARNKHKDTGSRDMDLLM